MTHDLDVIILLRAVKAGGGMVGLITKELARAGINLSQAEVVEWGKQAIDAGLLRRMGSDGAAQPVLQLTTAGQAQLLAGPPAPVAPLGPRLRLSPLAARSVGLCAA